MPDLTRQRHDMVEQQIIARGIRDPRLLAALRTVPRHRFTPEDVADRAYDDGPLSIGNGQTISQPYIVARMIEALQLAETDRVLDIGTGSGYAAAVLSRLVARVYTVERIRPLLEFAVGRFTELGYDNIETRHGDGTLGWPEHAPYNAIVAAAVAAEVPPALHDQLATGGRLVMPVGDRAALQTLICEIRNDEKTEFERHILGEVRFVPLISTVQWPQS
jgi:protein-L-isoaspartate(D-aspartate) O-methyltransferase